MRQYPWNADDFGMIFACLGFVAAMTVFAVFSLLMAVVAICVWPIGITCDGIAYALDIIERRRP